MTVRDLIEQLNAMPPDARVVIDREGYAIVDDERDPSPPMLNDRGEVAL